MTKTQTIDESLRAAILSQPDAILDDKDLMSALIAANEKNMGSNIVDLRGIAMDRLETRLDRLEDTHRSVIAAAYENVAGTNQIHRAVLRLLDATGFEDCLRILKNDIAEILRVDAVRLVLETGQSAPGDAVPTIENVLCIAPETFIEDYLIQGRNGVARQVTLRNLRQGEPAIYGAEAGAILSEACLKLDFGADRLPGLLVFGAKDPQMFNPQQGTDLLVFFAGVFEKVVRRWLS